VGELNKAPAGCWSIINHILFFEKPHLNQKERKRGGLSATAAVVVVKLVKGAFQRKPFRLRLRLLYWAF
jgi:hypothetical protein